MKSNLNPVFDRLFLFVFGRLVLVCDRHTIEVYLVRFVAVTAVWVLFLFPVFTRFPSEVIFHSRVLGTAPVSADCIVAMSYCCKNNSNNNNNNTLACCTTTALPVRSVFSIDRTPPGVNLLAVPPHTVHPDCFSHNCSWRLRESPEIDTSGCVYV